MEHGHVTPTAGALDSLDAPELFHISSGITDDAEHRTRLKCAVAALPRTAIGQMQRRELIFAIRTAELPWLSGTDRRLEFADRPTLERLAFLARRTCRRQLNDPPAASNGKAPAPSHGHPRDPHAARDDDPPAVSPQHWREKPR